VALEDHESGDHQGTFRSMSNSGTRRPAGRSPGVGRPVSGVSASKSGRLPVRPGTVWRPLLIERLAQADAPPIVSVVAPSGFGKTTLLSQWAEHDNLAFAWVPVEETDNDPKLLLRRIAQALDALEPIGRPVFDALTSAGSSIAGSVVPRLGSALMSMTSPVALVLDDVHVLRNSECRAALSMLADYVPRGSRLVLSGQVEPPLRIARLRAEGRVLEISPGDLSLTREEASWLLRDAGVVLAEQEVAELHRRTEGWPVGLYLAALYIREGASFGRVAASFGGDDLFVSEYVESEFLSRISRQQRVFLTRTAVLERMCGPLCDAVLELSGSAEELADLGRSNLLLVPLDRRGKWYRYHHLFRDMLLAELDRLEPELIPVLRRRAAAWCVRNDLPEPALEYSIAAGDVETAADLVGRLVLPTYQQGRVATVQRWFQWLQDRGGIGKHPMAAVMASVVSAVTGRPAEAERWADAVDRWQSGGVARPDDPPAEAWAALVRALLCRGGVQQMRADADEAVRRFATEGIMAPIATLCQGLARILSGDLDGGDASFADGVIIATEAGAPEGLAEALSERSLVAMARGEWSRAEGLAEQARSTLHEAGIEDSYATTLVCAVAARVALHSGDIQTAHQHLVNAQRTRALLTYAIPHMAVQARIELIRVHLAFGDLAGARTLMQEVNELLKRRPGLGSLVGEAQALRDRLAEERGSSTPGASSLTAAELRLLPMLSTHLSFAEIAAEMFLSRHTISSQAMSIYRKLGAGSRSQAVARSRDMGLLDDAPNFMRSA
jgi:LuxR family maltose regulon positive regulatory protein